jgi:hypothetical protein
MLSGRMIERGGLAGLKMLIMPSCYYITEPEAAALDAWVRGGGVLLCEAHLAGYNATAGRHSRRLPGCGLAEAWGLREVESTSSLNLKLGRIEHFKGAAHDDVQKAMKESGTTGAMHFPIQYGGEHLVWGAYRYAALEGEGLTVEGTIDGQTPCLGSKAVGAGEVFYCGSNLGLGAADKGNTGLVQIIARCARRVGIRPTLTAGESSAGQVHADVLEEAGVPRYLVVLNRSGWPQNVRLAAPGRWKGIYSGTELEVIARMEGETDAVAVPAGLHDLFTHVEME